MQRNYYGEGKKHRWELDTGGVEEFGTNHEVEKSHVGDEIELRSSQTTLYRTAPLEMSALELFFFLMERTGVA